ncbi:hypothetical protein [Staphylothermus hellenicus]|uniref:DUF131 domain-containing protein n=1 Tax=Staphylothermus hellenicus (strain DSM 12710 / JCM 10830 / BK20S6-10-b1 / P8) TaxID=591019 RepID=D7DA63_STAHD|nr:hypothetical protein [Staphylothermus hellenicus]ADI32659.1 hypothetical protein Shell_1571 [Staphylothermus hellenicus DSM 12710]
MFNEKYVMMGMFLIIIGFLLLAFSTITLAPTPSNTEGGGVVCIVLFFIPICIATGNLNPSIIYALIALSILTIIIFVFMLWIIIYKTHKHLNPYP